MVSRKFVVGKQTDNKYCIYFESKSQSEKEFQVLSLVDRDIETEDSADLRLLYFNDWLSSYNYVLSNQQHMVQ